MRIVKPIFVLLFLLICVIASGAYAQDGFNPETTTQTQTEGDSEDHKLYNECLAQDDPVLNEEEQKEHCACIHAHSVQYKKDLENGRFDGKPVHRLPHIETKKRHYVNIYAPCTYIYFYREQYYACYGNQNYHEDVRTIGELQQLCHCIASNVEKYVRQMAPTIIENTVTRKHNINDPVQMIKISSEYTNYVFKTIKVCRHPFRNRQ